MPYRAHRLTPVKSSSRRCGYRSSVIAAVAWPSIRCTTLTLAPADIANHAVVWRSPCGTNPSIPTSAQALSNARRYSSMGSSPPLARGHQCVRLVRVEAREPEDPDDPVASDTLRLALLSCVLFVLRSWRRRFCLTSLDSKIEIVDFPGLHDHRCGNQFPPPGGPFVEDRVKITALN